MNRGNGVLIDSSLQNERVGKSQHVRYDLEEDRAHERETVSLD